MQYKTTIEVVTEADSEYEATDIAGEFLKGNINTGADIKVRTMSAVKARKMSAFVIAGVTVAALTVFLAGNKVSYEIAKAQLRPVTSYAIQPPLKTNLADIQNSSEFKKIWEKEHKDRADSIAR
jgi:hypothetical protein